MSVEIKANEDRQLQTSAGGVTTMTRVMLVEADNLMEIATSTKIPKRGSRHPQNTAFYLDTIEVIPNGNANRRVQALATLTYNNSSELLKEFNEEPWELGAQNFDSHYISTQVPFITGYDAAGNRIQNLNSAKCRIAAETTAYIREITFMYCVKASGSRDFDGATQAIVNKSSVKVAGITIEPLTGLLLPQGASFITEYEEAGDEIKRQYWEVQTTIQINENGWAKNELDIGTMAFFKDGSGKIIPIPRNIYSYTPWMSKDQSQNMKTTPKFGSIDDVIAAKNAYAKVVSGYDPSSSKKPTDQQMQQYQQAWDALPFSEITEQMPLRTDGTLYEEALSNPTEYPYNEIQIYDTLISSWNKFDLPRTRI